MNTNWLFYIGILFLKESNLDHYFQVSSFLSIADILVGVRWTTNSYFSNLPKMSLFQMHAHLLWENGQLASHLALPARSPHFLIFICLHINGKWDVPSWFAFQVIERDKKRLHAKSLAQIVHSGVSWTLFQRKIDGKQWPRDCCQLAQILYGYLVSKGGGDRPSEQSTGYHRHQGVPPASCSLSTSHRLECR